MLAHVEALFSTLRFWDAIDVAIVSFVLYQIYMLLKNTRAESLIKGVFVIALAALVSNWLELHVVKWLLQKSMTVLLVALPVVFQPELRRALEQLGRGSIFAKHVFDDDEVERILNELSIAIVNMSKHKIGALIVIERNTGLSDYLETGIKIDSAISSELIINIFIPNTPLHDGATIICGDRIAAAACLLPLTEVLGLSKELGTRHRAAIGLSEQSDALVFVVSEETGTISLAAGGHLRRNLTSDDIKNTIRPVMSLGVTSVKDQLLSLLRKWGYKK